MWHAASGESAAGLSGEQQPLQTQQLQGLCFNCLMDTLLGRASELPSLLPSKARMTISPPL